MRHNKALQVQLNTSQGLEASREPAKPGQASEGRRPGRGVALAGAQTGWLCCTGCIADARTRQRQHRTLHLRSATFRRMAAGQTESPVCQKTSTRSTEQPMCATADSPPRCTTRQSPAHLAWLELVRDGCVQGLVLPGRPVSAHMGPSSASCRGCSAF